MSFQVIPAIDVHRGRLARMGPVRPMPVDAFRGDPLAAATAFAAAGARWIHVVDLDLAFAGRPDNLDVLGRIAALGVSVQASGGLSSEEEVSGVLKAGASRAVLGSAALALRPLAERLIGRHGERLAVGLEVDGDAIRPRSREADLALDVFEAAEWLASAGATRFVLTDVANAGGASRAFLSRLRKVAARVRRPVIAAGGIATLEDLRAVAALGPRVEGVIVGRALYDGTLDVRSALAGFPWEGPGEAGR